MIFFLRKNEIAPAEQFRGLSSRRPYNYDLVNCHEDGAKDKASDDR
jgi:hypothetical protein